MPKMFLRSGKSSMEYKVVISETCLEEIEDICDYIETKLKADKASDRLRIKIRDNIRNLKHSPERFATSGKKDRKNREYRKIIIGNYVILYTIIEEDKAVLVSHMYYTGKDYMNGMI